MIHAGLLVGAGAVLSWRVAALAVTASQGKPLTMPALLAGVGVAFLVCGLRVYRARPDRAGLLFALFCLASGLHWGGPLDLPAGGLRTALLLLYLLLSGFLAATLLLHLALRFPAPWRLAERPVLVRLLYLPTLLAALPALALLILPAERGAREAAQGFFLLSHTLVSNLFSATALALVAAHVFRRDAGLPLRRQAGLVVAGMLVAWLPYLVAAGAGAETDPWNLFVVALPIAFTLALLDQRARGASAAATALLLAGICLPTAAASAPTPLSSAETVLPSDTCRGLFVVPLTVGPGDGVTLDMLLDTGSAWTLVDPGSARRALGDLPGARRLTLAESRIGGFRLGTLRARLLEMEAIALAVGRPLDGILGFPVFEEVLLTLDYLAGEVRVAAGSLPPVDGRTVLRDVGSRRPKLRMEVGGRRVDLVVDSGATRGFLLRPSDRLTWSAAPRPAISVVTAYGVRLDEVGRLEGELRLGPLRFEEPIVVVADRERNLGLGALRHFVVTFDQRRDRIALRAAEPGPVRLAPFAGSGLGLRPRPDGLEVVAVFPGTSAEAAGLRTGDLVVEIDGVSAHQTGCGDPEGPAAGTRQVLSFLRDGVRATAEIEVRTLVP